MNRFLKTLFLALIIVTGVWALYHRQQIHSVGDAIELAALQFGIDDQMIDDSQSIMPGPGSYSPNGLAPSTFSTGDGFQQMPRRAKLPSFQRQIAGPDNRQISATGARLAASPSVPNLISRLPPPDGTTIRIASFKLDSRSTDGDLRATTDICEQFDVVVIQNKSELAISKLVRELNRRGHDYRFVDQANSNQNFGTIFNQQTVILENQHWYTVNDPEDLFEHEPLVAWFRARNAPPNEAFTFTLANIQLNAQQPDQEIAYLGELFRAIRLDGRGEDDIILAGDFQSSDRQLKKLQSANSLNSAIVGQATNTRHDMQLDNLVFSPKATVEFTGESGVFDFMKRFNMTLEKALRISNRLPVWAEFSVLEGSSPGRAAPNYRSLAPSR